MSGELSAESIDNPSPVLELSPEGKIIKANPASWLVLQHWQSAIGEKAPGQWASLVHSAFENNRTESRILGAGYVSIHLLFVPDLSAGVVRAFGTDVSSTRQSDRELQIKAHVYSQAHEAVVVTDADFRTIDINPSYTRLTGFDEADELGEPPSFLEAVRHDPEQDAEFVESLETQGSWHGETWSRTRDGGQVPVRVSVTAVRLDQREVTHYVAFLSDITSSKAAEEQLYRMAHYDALTGLANRHLFADRIHSVISRANRTGEQFAVMLVDLDGFKRINDTLGHRAGDQLLQTIARKMGESVRDSDLVSRFGGDEFAVLVRDLALPNDAVLIARKILTAVSETTLIDGEEVYVTASIGIALYPRDQTEIEPLLQKADSAMYRIKRLGKNDFHFFSDEFAGEVNRNLTVQTRLRRAIDRDEIRVHYQPQIDTSTGRLLGVEALARWHDKELGDVPPNSFIPMAEEFGLIQRLGEAVLRTACRQGSTWEHDYGVKVRIGVNVSARQLRHKGFCELVGAILKESRFEPEQLELELTETVFVEDPSEAGLTINTLASLGTRLAIDDFGTRYASLLYIKRLPVHRLKIDRAFVEDLPGDGSAGKIVAAIVALGHGLGCDVVAEGVETEQQIICLQELGCCQIQGYACSPAVAAISVEDIVRTGLCVTSKSGKKVLHRRSEWGTVVKDA